MLPGPGVPHRIGHCIDEIPLPLRLGVVCVFFGLKYPSNSMPIKRKAEQNQGERLDNGEMKV